LVGIRIQYARLSSGGSGSDIERGRKDIKGIEVRKDVKGRLEVSKDIKGIEVRKDVKGLEVRKDVKGLEVKKAAATRSEQSLR